ncbi:hypothetical protein BDV96DRAFT_598957 [Lophiotrema nucula]|uniref:Uncharacterized protein n=1 Tax=Lophiotrema nucula TaxID=690887 RepID=A0A6A5ZBC9_9PLEO|nr:hypothetical protein BDV96DRAFT_598957 [Lophiotrema nucula]
MASSSNISAEWTFVHFPIDDDIASGSVKCEMVKTALEDAQEEQLVCITMNADAIHELMKSLAKAPATQLDEAFDSFAKMTVNWGDGVSSMMPDRADIRGGADPSQWKGKILALMRGLSDFTHGQAASVGELLVQAAEARQARYGQKTKMTITQEDVMRVYTDICAKLKLATIVNRGKKARWIGRDAAARGRNAAHAKSLRDADAGFASDEDLDALTSKLGKARIPGAQLDSKASDDALPIKRGLRPVAKAPPRCLHFFSQGYEQNKALLISVGEHFLETVARVIDAFSDHVPPFESDVVIYDELNNAVEEDIGFDVYEHDHQFTVKFPDEGTGAASRPLKKVSAGPSKPSSAAQGERKLVVPKKDLPQFTIDIKEIEGQAEEHDNYKVLRPEQQALDAIQENWGAPPMEILFDESKGIDLRPKRSEPEPEPWELDPGFQKRYRKQCEEQGWDPNPGPDPKNPLDWGLDLLVPLALLSDYTEGASKDIVLAVLNVFVFKRVEIETGGAALLELTAIDVVKVIKYLIHNKGELDPQELMAKRSLRDVAI